VTGRGAGNDARAREDAERDARERKTSSFVRYLVAKMRGEVSSWYEFRERELRIAHLERELEAELGPGEDGPDEVAGVGQDDLLGGVPYMKADYEAAGKLHKAGKMTVDGIEKRRELSTKRAYRIYRQFRASAVIFDDVGLRPGPGYRWDPDYLDEDPPQYKLIRG
jgi:hypothetical protein